MDWPNFLRLVAQQVYDEEAMLSLPLEQEAILKEAVEKLEESGEVSLIYEEAIVRSEKMHSEGFEFEKQLIAPFFFFFSSGLACLWNVKASHMSWCSKLEIM